MALEGYKAFQISRHSLPRTPDPCYTRRFARFEVPARLAAPGSGLMATNDSVRAEFESITQGTVVSGHRPDYRSGSRDLLLTNPGPEPTQQDLENQTEQSDEPSA